MNLKIVLATVLLISLSSCSNDKNILKAEIAKKNHGNVAQFTPGKNFTLIRDSVNQYYAEEDYRKVLSAEIYKGGTVYTSNNFDLRLILIHYQNKGSNSYEIILRSFDKNFKIIDSYTIAENYENLTFKGELKENLKIISVSSDSSKTTAEINEFGKFKKLD